MISRRLDPPPRYDLAGTLGGLALIRGDPTLSGCPGGLAWATRTPSGPGTVRFQRHGGDLIATGYGPGADWLIDRADAIAGLRDDVSTFPANAHPLIRDLWRRYPGLRLPATGRLFHHLVPAILGQKVTGAEARRGYVGLVAHFASPAPGPDDAPVAPDSAAPGPGRDPVAPGADRDPVVPPDADAVAATPYWAFHPWGIERRRADTIRGAARRAARLEEAADSTEATRRLTALPGVGPWTAAEVVRVAFGDADAVSVGDFNLKHTVSWALAGEARGTDERMLELLHPFSGHRGRVCALLNAAGLHAPRFGPRVPARSFARF